MKSELFTSRLDEKIIFEMETQKDQHCIRSAGLFRNGSGRNRGVRSVARGAGRRWRPSSADRAGRRDKSALNVISFFAGVLIRYRPSSPALIPFSTQNAPGFAFFGLIWVRFLFFRPFGRAKFSSWFLCTLPHSVYRLKSLVIPLSRDVSFLT